MKSGDYFDESLASTPKPTATSTITKKQPTDNQIPARKPLYFETTTLEESTASLGILKPTEMNLTTYSESGGSDVMMNRLRTQRDLAKSLIDKVSKNVGGLPSKYFQQNSMLQDSTRNYTKDFSTVNESDLLVKKDSVNSHSFYPGNVSTPRTSQTALKETSMYENIAAMSEQLRNSDVNIKDLCSQYRASFGKSSMSQQTSGFESQVFVPAELMSDELRRDELSWRQQMEIPGEKNRNFSISSVNGKPSIGNFFETNGRNDLGELFKAKSPERAYSPTPLIDTTCSVRPSESVYKPDNKTFKKPEPKRDSSILSITKIQKMLSEVDTDSPGKMIDVLFKNDKAFKATSKLTITEQRRSKSKSPNPPPSKEHDCDDYLAQSLATNSHISSNQYKTSDIGAQQNVQAPTSRRKSTSPHDMRFSATYAQSSSIQAQQNSRDSDRNHQEANTRRKSTSPHDMRFSATYAQSSPIQTQQSSRDSDRNHQEPNTRRKSTSPCDDTRFSAPQAQSSRVQHSSRECKNLQVPTTRKKSTSPNDDMRFSAQSSRVQGQHSSRDSDKLQVLTTHRKSRSPNDDMRFSLNNAQMLTVQPYSSRDSGVRSMESEANSNLRYSSRVSTASSGRDNKENVYGRSGSSMGSRCPSSLDSIPDGKFPIKGNKVEIVWGCIKVGRGQTESFQIKNQLNQKVRIQVSVIGSNFQLIKEGNEFEMLTLMIFTLHPFETKTLSIIFRPSKMGAISEKLVFYPYSNGEIIKNLKQTIKLFGYGGHISVDLTKISKDSNGNLWLSMGSLGYKPIVQHFSIKNTGVLSAFAILELENDGLMSKSNNVKINPMEIIIKPQQEIKITVQYIPKAEDFKSQNEIIDVGSFKLVSGSEVVRGRLRRLSQKSENIDKTIKRLSKQLPGEDIPRDLGILNEGSSSSIHDLLKSLTVKQIRLNVEKNPNVTLETSGSYFNNTTMFQTLYQDCTTIQDENDYNKPNKIFTVDPNRIVFSLPSKKDDKIFFQSRSTTSAQFKIMAPEGFKISPSSGVISSDEMVIITVICTKMRNAVGKMYIYVMNETIEVDLKTVLLRN